MELLTLGVATLTLAAVIYSVLAKKDRPAKPVKTSAASVVVDTSALMDGRILEVAKTGFLPAAVIIPKFVVAEMQMLADNGNAHKRDRARYGMEIVTQLQETKSLDVVIDNEDFAGIKEVDDKLVALAKKRGAVLFTTDFNLNKVAAIEGVKVLNVNELAQQLRPVVLPGETKDVKIVQRGEARQQGVGYLEDGTMVVVEEGAKHMNETVTVEFQRSLQTVAGKMIFGAIKSKPRQRHIARAQSRR